ncbi:MAG: ADP-forming succinate--CoA ligase subunit beta [Puniceicoccales bacterium]|jgi:succinyl-CoA synthetase beta subunit|nr:ADP-forming succinate--CoA ligase subunit beta [Puniceicoccales bacterium]
MKVHEYQTKCMMVSHGIPIGRAVLIGEGDVVEEKIAQLGSMDSYAVKAQIHSGGRGKGVFADGFRGGVHVVHSAQDAITTVRRMLANRLITQQTGENGHVVRKVYVEEGFSVVHEFYVAILLDRSLGKPIVIASRNGGVDIEESLTSNEKKIHREIIEPQWGLQIYQARRLAMAIGLQRDDLRESFVNLLENLYRFYWESDALLVEVNPLAETVEGKLQVIDGKSIHDDNALFRQPTLRNMVDLHGENEQEIRASRHGVNYVPLRGNIACLTNGAGLAMATMDLLQSHGLQPANFLDLGDNSGESAVMEACAIILENEQVQCLLLNIFGGAMRGDVVARGLLKTLEDHPLRIPLVVRIEGAYAKEGIAMLQGKIPQLVVAENLENIPQQIKCLLADPQQFAEENDQWRF